jgi:hypothetical protein
MNAFHRMTQDTILNTIVAVGFADGGGGAFDVGWLAVSVAGVLDVDGAVAFWRVCYSGVCAAGVEWGRGACDLVPCADIAVELGVMVGLAVEACSGLSVAVGVDGRYDINIGRCCLAWEELGRG